MNAALSTIRNRAGVVGAVVLMFAATACLIAMCATAGALVLSVRAGKVSAEQINVLSLAFGMVGSLIGFVGALLATPDRHGRATDPEPRP